MNIVIKTYDELTKDELYEIAMHRQNVLIIDQQTIFHDLDGRDDECIHVMAYDNNGLIGYARIMPSSTGLHGKHGSFGRLSVKPELRRKGIGGEIVKACLDYLVNVLHEESIQISAMSYLEHFYTELGFKRISDVYQIEGVDHIDMEFNQ